MHALASLIIDLTLILGVASLVTILFQKLRQPVVLGYLVAGALISPHVFSHDFISDDANIKTISELGVIFLMFSLGLEFSFHKLKRVGFSATVTGMLEVLAMLIVGFCAGKLLGWSFFDSLFLGAALAISSTTIIIKAIEELHLKRRRFAEIIFGILVLEDLLAILLLVGLSTLAASHHVISTEMGWALVKLVLVIGSWFLMGYFLIPTFFHRIKHYVNDETLLLVSIALCLFLVLVASYFHYSPALGAFIMGSILSETPLIRRIEQLVKPIRDIFAAVFFVSIGMLIDPHIMILHWPSILVVCGVTILGKIFATGVSAFLSGQRFTDAVQIGFGMAQIGEFSFIIAALGLTLGVINPDLFPIIIAVSAITTFSTPYLIRFSENFSKNLYNFLPSMLQRFLDGYTHGLRKLLRSPAQESMYRNSGTRLIVNGVIVAVIFILTENWILPEIIAYLKITWLEKGLTWFIATALASPFIWGMLSAFHKSNLDNKTKIQMSPVIHFSWAITALELAVLSVTYFEKWLLSTAFFIGALLLFRLFYRQLDKSYQWFEDHLTHNLQSKENHEFYDAEYEIPWNTDIFELALTTDSALLDTVINWQELGGRYGINIIAIVHQGQIVWTHLHRKPILLEDRLVVLGEQERVNRFINKLQLLHQ